MKEKRVYEQRKREIEHSTFTPLVLSATAGMGKEATVFFKHLASMLAQKWEPSYSSSLCWLHCHLSFSLLHSAIQAITGARSSKGHAVWVPIDVELVASKSKCKFEY